MLRIRKTHSSVLGDNITVIIFFVSSLIVLIAVMLAIFTHREMIYQMDETIKHHLISAALNVAQSVPVDVLDRYHTREDTETAEYAELKEYLKEVAERNNVLWVYFLRYTEDGMGQFIIDNDDCPEESVGPWFFFEPMEEDLATLRGEVGVTDIYGYGYYPDWDNLISAFAPVYDEDGNFALVAGVDISD
jgi:deoxyribodipyrimidine photolyase-like uncharacterized protein